MAKVTYLGPVPLDYTTLSKAKSILDEVPEIPAKLIVPKGYMIEGAKLLKLLYGDLAIAIRVEWQEMSMSWALVGKVRTVASVHPTIPGQRGKIA